MARHDGSGADTLLVTIFADASFDRFLRCEGVARRCQDDGPQPDRAVTVSGVHGPSASSPPFQ